MSNYTYTCQNCNYQTDTPTIDCPKCSCFMRGSYRFSLNTGIIICALCFALVVLANLNSLYQDIIFHFKHSKPIVSYVDKNYVNPFEEPTQNNFDDEKLKFLYRTKKGDYTLIPKAQYKIAGMVVAKNTNFWLRDLMRSEFDGAFLIDLVMVWGDLVDPDYRNYSSFKSQKTLASGRKYWYRLKSNSPVSIGYVSSHSSHNHIIPANENIMSALYNIKIDSIVELQGYLIDSIFPSGRTDKTSLSRTDSDPLTENGSCERIYVTKVKIGNDVFE